MCSKEIQHNISDFCHLSGKKSDCRVQVMVTGPKNLSALSTIQRGKVIQTTCIMKKYIHD